MFSGPPLPLPSHHPLTLLLDQVRPRETLGAWTRESTHRLEIHCARGGRLLVSADLGFLLGRCSRVVLREGSTPVILDADTVIGWRTLQVITALPHLPGMDRLAQQYPGIITWGPLTFLIPIHPSSPEEVLVQCLATGMQVTGSHVVYYPPPLWLPASQ
jgi:hypothetical protein